MLSRTRLLVAEERVRLATPLIRSQKPPPAYEHVRNNPKRRMMLNDRSQEIDAENMILLNKMRGIFQHGTAATNRGANPRAFEVETRSLNQDRRRRELERITRENLGIVHRIRSSKSMYSIDSLMRERQKTESILNRISRAGSRRTDIFSSSAVSSTSFAGSVASSTVSGRSAHGSLRRGRPQRLQSLSHSQSMPAGLPASMAHELLMPMGDVLDQHQRELEATADYGEAMAAAAVASMSVEDLRPVPMRLNSGKQHKGRGGSGPSRAPLHEPLQRGGTAASSPALFAGRPSSSPMQAPVVHEAMAMSQPGDETAMAMEGADMAEAEPAEAAVAKVGVVDEAVPVDGAAAKIPEDPAAAHAVVILDENGAVGVSLA